MKRRSICSMFVFVLALALLSPAPFSKIPNVEAASKKESLDTSVKHFLKSVKSFDCKTMNKYMKSKSEFDTSFYKNTPNMVKFFRKTNAKMTCKVLNTKKSGKTAQVKIKFKYVDSKEVSDAFIGYMFLAALGGVDFDEVTDSESAKFMEKLFTQSAKGFKIKKYKTDTVTVTFVKSGNNCKVKKVTDPLANAMTANFYSSFSDLSDNFSQ